MSQIVRIVFAVLLTTTLATVWTTGTGLNTMGPTLMGRTYVEGREVEMSPTQISESGHVIMLTADRKVGQLGLGSIQFASTYTEIPLSDILQIATGPSRSHFLTLSGELYATGHNDGTFGNNDIAGSLTPTPTLFLNGTVKISCGDKHTLFLALTNGTGIAYSTGDNTSGQLGIPGVTRRLIPSKINLNDVSDVAAGALFSLVLADGKVFAFGQNAFGQLGIGSFGGTVDTPTLLNSFENITIRQIAAGNSHSIFRCESMQVYTCGRNSKGQLGLSDNAAQSIPKMIPSLSGITSSVYSAYNSDHSVFQTTDGAWSSGGNSYGQLGNINTTDSYAPVRIAFDQSLNSISTGSQSTFLYFGDKKAFAYGSFDQIIARPIRAYPVNEDLASINWSLYVVFLLTKTGKVFVSGTGVFGQMGLGSQVDALVPVEVTVPPVMTVHGGTTHTVLLTTTGTVYVMGQGQWGALGLGDTTLQREPTLNFLLPPDIVQISAGNYHTLVRTNDTVWSFGRNDYGELGHGDQFRRFSPEAISLKNVSVLYASLFEASSFFLLFDGTVYACGENIFGSLGIPSQALVLNLTLLSIRDVVRIATSGQSAFLLTKNGDLYAAGEASYGRLGLGDGTKRTSWTRVNLTGVTYVKSGATFTYIVKKMPGNYGGVFAVGNNQQGVLGIGSLVSNLGSVWNWTPVPLHGILKQVSGASYAADFGFECPTGPFGAICEDPATKTCFGIPGSSSQVCSGNGTCWENDKCYCMPGFVGAQCEHPSGPVCYGFDYINPRVCSGNGTCTSNNVCKCRPGWKGLNCEQPDPRCFGKEATDPTVCSGAGKCLSEMCVCNPGYAGLQCNLISCFGIFTNTSTVCSGRGNCTSPNICHCFGNGTFTGERCHLRNCGNQFLPVDECPEKPEPANSQLYWLLSLLLLVPFAIAAIVLGSFVVAKVVSLRQTSQPTYAELEEGLLHGNEKL